MNDCTYCDSYQQALEANGAWITELKAQNKALQDEANRLREGLEGLKSSLDTQINTSSIYPQVLRRRIRELLEGGDEWTAKAN